MKKANLFIVGAMKAGTTSLTKMLSQHSEVYLPPIKEPHYFVTDLPKSIYNPSVYFSLENYFDTEFPNDLHIANLQTLEQYEKIYELAQNEKYLVDASTAYLNHPESAQLIYNYNPKGKILILLRDPIKRAYSHYIMNTGLGRETKDFETVIKEEINLFNAGNLPIWSYLGMSFYQENIEKYKKYFGDNVLLLNLDDYKKDKDKFLDSLSQFLDISKENIELPQSNQSRLIKNKALLKLLYDYKIKDNLSKILPKKITQLGFNLLSKNKDSNIPLSEETLQKIISIFETQNKNLHF